MTICQRTAARMSSLSTRQRSLAAPTASLMPTLKRPRLLRPSACGLVRRPAWYFANMFAGGQEVRSSVGSFSLLECLQARNALLHYKTVVTAVALTESNARCAAKAYLQQLRQARAEDRGDASGACAAPSQPPLAWLVYALVFRRKRPRCCRRTRLPAGAQATMTKRMRPWLSTCASRRRRCVAHGVLPPFGAAFLDCKPSSQGAGHSWKDSNLRLGNH